jgi:hypothetical protein
MPRDDSRNFLHRDLRCDGKALDLPTIRLMFIGTLALVVGLAFYIGTAAEGPYLRLREAPSRACLAKTRSMPSRMKCVMGAPVLALSALSRSSCSRSR